MTSSTILAQIADEELSQMTALARSVHDIRMIETNESMTKRRAFPEQGAPNAQRVVVLFL